MSAAVVHRELRHVHPRLSPVCVCGRCTAARLGWLTAWYAVLARLAGVPLDASLGVDEYVLLALAVGR